MNRLGWNLFYSLAALNVFTIAGYQWSLASSDVRPRYHTLVDAFEVRVPLAPAERTLLEDLETRVLAKRQELLPVMEMMAPRVRELLLANKLNTDELLALFQQNFPERLDYLRYEHEEFFNALQQLPPEKRTMLVDFMVEHRLNAVRRWVNQSAP
ncbi:hypothetical protein K2X85_13365 [bacterium]|jgi:hypothetical protein|nr:hypothetical protein [bacterium]